MSDRIRVGLMGVAVALLVVIGPLGARQRAPESSSGALPNYDIRAATRAAAPPAGELDVPQPRTGTRRARVHPHTGGLRVLDDPGLRLAGDASAADVRNLLASIASRLGLEESDLASLMVVRDYVGVSNGVRHIVFGQAFDGIPVFDGVLAAHVDRSGHVLRVSSSAGPGAARASAMVVPAEEAARLAAANLRPDAPFAPFREGGATGPTRSARFGRGPFLRDVTAQLVWLPVEGALRLAWRIEIEPDGEAQFYDVLVDAQTGEILLRRNRVFYAQGNGRVIQSAATQLLDPRRPDEMPIGTGSCPPAINHEMRDLTSPFRDSVSVLSNSGHLDGNNTHVFHGNDTTEAPSGTFDGAQWTFDFPFNSAGAAATTLFFALNYAHDFFYDLGFTEAAGNFQENNFGRGGVGGDAVHGIARAAGRNNATMQVEPDGASPIISMFLWDGTGCWSQDVDGDGSMDLDGDVDIDIVLHEFHHGVNHRLNTAFTGAEADAIGEGGSDFFAYSINGDTTLAEYAYPAGGLRSVNGKTYGDWSCLFGLFCEPHANGEIFANALWDVRERFRVDGVRGSEAAAINESHQLYVDALALSPPAPTMLDMRDSMLLADDVRNPGSPRSVNFCRLWESFAHRGMGTNATDSADNGFNQVTAGYAVPEGCTPPPAPPSITVGVTTATATEAGPVNGTFTVSRGASQSSPLTVYFRMGGTAANGTDYNTIPGSVTIPAGAASATVDVVPVNDTLLESNETVTLTLTAGVGYVVGIPSAGTVTIVSDDVAPDFVVSALTIPLTGGAGQPVSVSDTTKNQGTGPSAPSVTSFFLSVDFTVDASDRPLGSRAVPELAVGASHTATSTFTLPSPQTPGSYRIIAKADGPGAITETSELNNIRSGLIKIGPDLAVTSLTVPSTAAAGGTILVSDTTTNQGLDAADGSQTRFFLSMNALFDEADTPLQARTVGPLAAGASSMASTSVTIPAATPTGTFYVIARADAASSVAESTETNNTRYGLVRVGPDLQVTSISVPLRGASGGVIAISDTTRNAGSGSAGSSSTAFYLSADYRLDAADTPLAPARVIGPLAGGASSTVVTSVTLPAATPGTWYIIAQADNSGAVEETFENNNTRYATIAIGPDLDVLTVVGPTTVTAGVAFTMTDTVKNIGMGTAAASVTRIYLSLDYLLDPSDTLLGDRPVGALADNASSTGSITVTVPAGISGRVYLITMTDGATTVAESSESNNTLARLVTVNAP